MPYNPYAVLFVLNVELNNGPIKSRKIGIL